MLTPEDAGEAQVRSRDLGVAISLGSGAALSVCAGVAWLDEDVLLRLVPVLVLP